LAVFFFGGLFVALSFGGSLLAGVSALKPTPFRKIVKRSTKNTLFDWLILTPRV
jgi:hypothetical protein